MAQTRTRDSYWRIVPDPAADFGPVPLNGHSGPESVVTPGESYTLEVWLTTDSDSATGEWPDYVERYKQLLGYGLRAGQYAPHEPMGGGMRFTETHDGRVPGESLLVAARPPHDTEVGRGGWYLVDAMEGLTDLPAALCRIDIDVTLVAPLEDYADHAAARDALEKRGI